MKIFRDFGIRVISLDAIIKSTFGPAENRFKF